MISKVRKALSNARWHSFGRCNACGRATVFLSGGPDIERGGLHCPICRSFSRKRHVISVLLEGEGADSLRGLAARGLTRDVYSATATDVTYRYLHADPRFTASEYFPDLPPGAALPGGGQSENLEELTFEDDSFDVVLTEDVLEHVRYADRAFAEIARVLRPGGVHIFTVPAVFDRPTLDRVQPVEGGDDIMLAEPEYHGDNVHGNALAYRTFGIDLYDQAAKHGFETEVRHSRRLDRRSGIVDSYVFVSRLTP